MKKIKANVAPLLICLVGTSAGQHTATTLIAPKQFLAKIHMAQQDKVVVFAHNVLQMPNVKVNLDPQRFAIQISSIEDNT